MEDPNKDDITPEQSNAGGADDPADPVVDPVDPGTTDDPAESKTRGERREGRWVNKLSDEITAGMSGSANDELFPVKPHQPMEIKDGDVIDPKDVVADREAFGTSKFAEGANLGYQTATSRAQLESFDNRLDIDVERVEQKWDVLDPSKEDVYKPGLEKNLVNGYIRAVGMEKDQKSGRITIRDPQLRFRDYVDQQMEQMEEYAEAVAAKTTTNVASQARKTGVRPTGQAPAPKKDHGFDLNDPVNSVKRMTSDQYFKFGGKEASDAYLAERGLAPKV